jgi:hypothetical protein
MKTSSLTKLCLACLLAGLSIGFAEEQADTPLDAETATLVSDWHARGAWFKEYKGKVVAVSIDGERVKLQPGELRNLLVRLKTVSSVELIDCSVSADDLNSLDADNMRHLSMNDSKLSDADLEPVSKLVNLTRLSLTARNIDDKAMDAFKPLQKLQTLHLFYTKVTGSGIQALTALKSLETLSVKRGFWEKESAATYNGLTALSELSITAEGATPEFFENLHPPSLKTLLLYGEHETAPAGFAGYVQAHPSIDAKYLRN